MARRDRFQHATVPGSFFYTPSIQRFAWDRMEFEGYDWEMAGENIAAGFESARATFDALWRSAGHRANLVSRHFFEFGAGHFCNGRSAYIDYYSLNFGKSWGARFFTDTLFDDLNNNRAYDRGEGVAGVMVQLIVDGVPHGMADVSAGASSFAIPIDSIPAGAGVSVVLLNQTGGEVMLCLPRDYDAVERWMLAPGEARAWGAFQTVEPGGKILRVTGKLLMEPVR
jgi:hypothetical protein